MKKRSYTLFVLALLAMANGLVVFYFRYNFVTQERYGPSLTPIYICGVGLGLAVLGLACNTRIRKAD